MNFRVLLIFSLIIVMSISQFQLNFGISPSLNLPNFENEDSNVQYGMTLDGNIPFMNFGLFDGLWNVDFRLRNKSYEQLSYMGGIKIPLTLQSTLDRVSQNFLFGREIRHDNVKQWKVKSYVELTKVLSQSWSVNFRASYNFLFGGIEESFITFGVGVNQKIF